MLFQIENFELAALGSFVAFTIYDCNMLQIHHKHSLT